MSALITPDIGSSSLPPQQPVWMFLRLAPGVLKTRPDGLKQFRTLTGASPRIIENRLQCEFRKYDPMSDVQSRVEIVGYLFGLLRACASPK
jgi:hypothetical protein